MRIVAGVLFLSYLVIVLTWWLQYAIAAVFVIRFVVTAVRGPRDVWRRPALWGLLSAGSAFAFLATVAYGMSSMKSHFKKDPGDPCHIDDDVLGNEPILDWPLSDTGCGGYESVPAFVNPVIFLFAAVLLASTVAVITTWRRARARAE
ncbi:hypothetical protein LZ318_02830 [Saccharopolyspora indica]|uniref:hypothetical protein n=1 Tax=Saccharopolyspora indica TaxID=1229659 RepID=UPI0022EAC3B8|nr:hypothetical protein [Saccharopolyspora indica]MDA3649410.1 hypothetical protein [Saccharopolyspora indica]